MALLWNLWQKNLAKLFLSVREKCFIQIIDSNIFHILEMLKGVSVWFGPRDAKEVGMECDLFVLFSEVFPRENVVWKSCVSRCIVHVFEGMKINIKTYVNK